MKDLAATSSSEVDYLRTIETTGISSLLRNGAGLSARTVCIDGRAVPVIVSDGKRGKPSIFSPRAHYLDYPIHEIAQSSQSWTHGRLRGVLLPLTALLRFGRIDKVVYVNHWLLNGSPPLGLDGRQLEALLALLRSRYPGHALVFSAIVPELAPRQTADLLGLGGLAVQSRVVHVLDPARSLRGRGSKNIRHARRKDAALLRDQDSRRVDQPERLLEHVGRMQELYSQIYLEKYPQALNPQYEASFFELLLRSGRFTATGWLGDGGNLEAFNIQHSAAGIIHWSVCGYDRKADPSRGWFRVVTARDTEAATRERQVLNWGAGNAPFKRHRGAEPLFEYDIVFHDHLGTDRRLPWWVLHHGRAFKNGAPRTPVPVAGRSPSPALTGSAPGTIPARPRVALVTSNLLLAGPLLERCSQPDNNRTPEIPLAVWLQPSMRASDRLRDLLRTVRRQAALNRTTPSAQLVHHFVHRWLAATTKHGTPPASIELLQRGRAVMTAVSGNAPEAVSALRESRCDVGLVIGGDVLGRRTLQALEMPMLNVHFSDPGFIRGLPPVFWEILDHRDSITLTLHCVTWQLDAGVVVLQREVPIVWRPTLAETLRQTRVLAAAEIAPLVIEGIPRWQERTAPAKPIPPGPLRTTPTLWDSLRAEWICRQRFRRCARDEG